MSAQMKARPTLLGMAAAIATGCVLLVFAAEGMLRVVMPHWQEFYSGRFMRAVSVPEHVPVTTGRPGFDRVINRTAGELANLKAQLPARIPFAVLIAPARFKIRDGDPAYQKVRQEIVRELAARGIAVIDPIKEFLDAGFQPTHFAHDGHWSPLGHKIAARAAAGWLSRQNIGN